MKTNGIPIDLNYNTVTKDFTFSYELNLNTINHASSPTEIMVPSHVYPNGFEVILSEHLKWSYDESNYIVSIYLNEDLLKENNYDNKYSFEDIIYCKVKIYSK